MKITQDLKALSGTTGGRSSSPPVGQTTAVSDLHIALFRDVSDSVDYDCTQDIVCIHKRIRHEGFAFLSKTLPQMDKALLSGLQEGLYQQTIFAKTTKNGTAYALPRFTGGLLSRIFDIGTGIIHAEPDVNAIKALHQLYTFTYKYEVALPDDVIMKNIKQMITTDRELPQSLYFYKNKADYPIEVSDFVLLRARSLLESVLKDCDLENIVPKHGPGASNEKLLPHEKYHFTRYSPKLGVEYPEFSYTSGTLAQALHDYPKAQKVIVSDGVVQGTCTPEFSTETMPQFNRSKHLDFSLQEFLSMCSKVCSVPKNSTTSRIISSEPVGNMWIQQGQNAALTLTIESHPWTKGHVNFTNQTINQELALAGSLHGNLSTLDMSEASDRVARAIIYALFSYHLFKKLDASRSEFSMIVWPNGRKSYIRLNKFAPMGSATCFPLEALVFWALSVATIMEVHHVSRELACEAVYVYGDDIIVPTHFSSSVMNMLPSFGFKINTRKSFTTGLFRESCGMDAYGGVDVTPLKLKTLAPQSIKDAESICGWVDFANLCKDRGYTRVFEMMKNHVEHLAGELPTHHEKISILTWRGESNLELKPERKPLDNAKPYYCGSTVLGWKLEVKKYIPDPWLFPRSLAMMRRTVKGPSKDVRYRRKCPMWPEPLDIIDSNEFSTRYSVKLKRKRVFLS